MSTVAQPVSSPPAPASSTGTTAQTSSPGTPADPNATGSELKGPGGR
jgi:hypothetical protein